MDSLEQRVDRLEKSVRRWRAGACVCGVALAAAVLVGAQRRAVELVEARAITVVDDAGQTLFGVVPGKNGGAALEMKVGGGTLHIADARGGPMILMSGPADRVAWQLTATKSGGGFTLYGADGEKVQSLPAK